MGEVMSWVEDKGLPRVSNPELGALPQSAPLHSMGQLTISKISRPTTWPRVAEFAGRVG